MSDAATPIDAGRAHRPSRSLVKALRRIPQYTRPGRHARALLRHSTPRRLLNLAIVELEFRLRRQRLRGRPYVLIVDPTNACNLRCPLCPTGTGDLGRPTAMMPWDVYTQAIDQLAPWAYEVNLYNWGESILHPRIWDMIRYARDRNLATNMSANLNQVRPGDIDRLIHSGLENLTLSIDGATQEAYAHYRRRGQLDVVLANVRELMERRRALGSRTPWVEWQFIVMKHNWHEIEAARALADELGVDEFRVIPPGLPFEASDPERLKSDWFPPSGTGDGYGDFRGQQRGACFYLYRSFVVNPDGGTAPCCVVYGQDNDFGDITRQAVSEIWNGEKYRSARSLFSSKGGATVPTVCDRCDWFEKRSARTGKADAQPGGS